MEFSSPVTVNPLEVCDFSGLRCGTCLVITSQQRPQTRGVVCGCRALVQDLCLHLSSLPWVEIEGRGYLMSTENLQISLLLYFESHTPKLHEWMRYGSSWRILECAETRRMGLTFPSYPTPAKKSFNDILTIIPDIYKPVVWQLCGYKNSQNFSQFCQSQVNKTRTMTSRKGWF